jgi:hypothetical protein
MFWNKKSKSPITEEDESWVESSYAWFAQNLGIDLRKQEIYLPTAHFLGFHYKGTEDDLLDVVDLVAGKMGIDSSTIEVYFFEEFQPIKFTDEGMHSKYEDGTKLVEGEYSKVIDGLYQIGIERNLLEHPLKLIATVAHELAHIKLLGEERLEENDEPLTDLSACMFGFVIFIANNAISKMETWSGNTHTGWQINGAAGYVHYKVYAFLIAYWLQKREEKNPEGLGYLDKEIYNEVKKATKYLEAKKK